MVKMRITIYDPNDENLGNLEFTIVCKNREQAVMLCKALSMPTTFVAKENGVDISVMIADYRTE